MVRASLVIPTRNRAAVLDRTLAALTAQRERAFEVIVADDGSDDDTPAVARRYAADLDLRYLRRAHRGIAAARSAAMRAARADVLIQTDDDRLCDPDFVGDHVAAHAEGGPWVIAGQQRAVIAAWSVAAELPSAAVAATVARQPALAARFGEAEAELISAAALRAGCAEVLAGFAVDEPWWTTYAAPVIAACGLDLDGFAFPWTIAIGGNTSVPRGLAEAVGFLDEGFTGWGLEDTDFHYRLCAAGARVRVIAGGTSYHQLHRRGPERVREWLINARRILDKHASLPLGLYVAALRRGTPLVEASRAAAAIAASAGPEAQAELIRAHRELVG